MHNFGVYFMKNHIGLRGRIVQISFNHNNHMIIGCVNSATNIGIFLTVFGKEYKDIEEPQIYYIPFNSILYIKIKDEK